MSGSHRNSGVGSGEIVWGTLYLVPFKKTIDVFSKILFLLITLTVAALSSQGLNPGKAIAEIKKMMATYKEKKAAAV